MHDNSDLRLFGTFAKYAVSSLHRSTFLTFAKQSDITQKQLTKMPPFDVSTEEVTNPLMTLVDAAASILGKPGEECDNSEETPATCPTSSLDESEAECPRTPVNSGPTTILEVPLSRTSKSANGEVSSEATQSDCKKLSFAEQLMAVLDDESYSDIITWMPDGKAFTIVDPKEFTKEHMPRLFNIRNMSSFVRKLTRWGFSRVHEKVTMNSDIFKHKEFQKGKTTLCAEIKCLGRTQTFGQSPSSVKAVIKTLQPSGGEKKTTSDMVKPTQRAQDVYSSSVRSNILKAALESLNRTTDPVVDALALHHILTQHSSAHSIPILGASSWANAPGTSLFSPSNNALATWGAYHRPLPY